MIFFARLSADAPPAAVRCRVCARRRTTSRAHGSLARAACSRALPSRCSLARRPSRSRASLSALCGLRTLRTASRARSTPSGRRPPPSTARRRTRTRSPSKPAAHAALRNAKQNPRYGARLAPPNAHCALPFDSLGLAACERRGGRFIGGELRASAPRHTWHTRNSLCVYIIPSEPAVAACELNKHTFLIQKD